MKKLSETWKQKKPLVGLTRSSDSGVKLANTGTKRLGRVAITASNRSGNATTGFENKLSTAKTSCAGSPGSVDCSISSSFGPDLDADVISAVNSLEAAAYEADRRIDSLVSAQIQSVPTRTPTRQNLQRLGQAGSIPGKRKNARSRRSGASKPSLFGDVGGNYLPLEPFTPTQSPRDKRRKSYETEGEESGRTAQMSLLALSSPKSRLLCPASPSPELGTGSNHLPLRCRKALSSASLPVSNRRLTNASGGGSANVNQHEELEEEEEIETDISPILSAVAKPTSKPIHGETPARTTGAAFSSIETYLLSVPEPASLELAKEVYSTQKCNGNQNEALGHPLRPFHPGLPTSAVTVSGVKESRTFRGDHINKAGQNENVPHPMQKSPTAEAKSFSFAKASAVQALAAKKRETKGSRFTRVRSDRRQKESPERALPERAPSPRKSLVASSTKSSVVSSTESSVASSTKSSIASPTKSTIASSTKPSIASPTKPTVSPPTKTSKSSTVHGLTSTVSKPPVLSSTRSSKPNLSSEASTTSAAKTSSTSLTRFQTDHDAAHLQAGHKTDVICSTSNPRETEAGRSTESGSHTVPQCSSVQVQETECMDIENVITAESVLSSKSKAADQLVGTGLGSQRAVSESLLLSSWGLPGPVLEAYHSQGITAMFPWQAECLTTGNVLGGGNLVYSAPTSAGKTMVAELLMLKRVLETRRKALFILPFVSVTREKMVSLQRLYQDAGVRVGGFMGSHSPAGGFRRLDVAVCTIEKGNSLVNRLMEENRIDELGVVVIDELHMVGDSNRGYLLELLLTKICYMAHKSRERSKCPIQVIGMSATLPNLDLLASWLSADLYHTDFRPVPLTEHIKVGTAIYDQAMTKVRDMEVKAAFQGDEEHIIPLCLETIMGGHSVLMFCPTKVWCEKLAEKIAREFHGIMKNPAALAAYTAETGFVKASEMARLPIDQVALRNVLEQLGRSPVGMDPMLGKVIQYGVAYHHAGLTFDERDIVEGAFRQGLVKILVATSTLSSGVNLPARRVIVRSVMFGGRVMDTLAYKQMAGRAGRKGVDTEADALGQPILAKRPSAKPQHQRLPHLPDLLALLFPCPRLAGECVLVCKEGERRMAQRLLSAHLRPVASCLQDVKDGAQLSRSMKRAILEVVVGGVASTPDDVARYVACTLLAASLPPGDESSAALITSCLTFLEDNEFVTLRSVQNADQQEVQKYQPTQLGSAVLASSMSPDEGLAVFAELQKARQCFVLANELHIIYLVTPIYSQEISGNLDWYHFYCMWEKLPPDMRLVAKTVGVEEGFLAKAVAGRVPNKTAAQARAVAVHRRFYTALALHDLVQEVPLLEVAARFNCNKGQLQSLMQSAATFAGMVTVFCARLGWANMELLLSQFQQRLTLGVTRELCDLVRIPLLTATMARMLFNAGYQTVAAVAHAAPEEVEAIFRKASPFQSTKTQEGESDWETEQRRKARCVWLGGRKGVTELEAATAIIGEAKTIIQQELGLRIDWQSGAEAGASAAADGCEGAEGLSASKTGLQRGKEASSASKTSPLLSSRSSSSSAPRRGSPSTGAEPGKATDTAEDSETSPPSSKRKRKSSEGREARETPAAVSGSTRALPRGSDPRRTGGRGTKAPCVKSPPPSAGGRDAGSRSGLKSSAHSPKDVSFFGQVVVSPPASIRRPARNAPRGPPGAEVAAGTPNSGGRASASTPTTRFRDAGGVRLFSRRRDFDGAEHSVVPRPGANRSDVGAGQMREKSAYDRLSSESSRCASTTATTTMAACGPSVKERCLDGKLQAPDIVPHAASDEQTCKGSSIDGNPGDGRNGSENMNNKGRMTTDRENRHPKSADAMHQALPKENGSNICSSRLYDCSTARAGHPLNVPHLGSAPWGPGAGVTVTAATNRVDKVPESAQGKAGAGAAVSSVPDRGGDEDASNCFDDSLILNTQTDNLLLGRLSDSSSVSDKSFENAIASTPLLPSLSAREAGRVVGKLTQPPLENTKHATVPPVAGSPAKEKGTGRASKQSIPDEGSTKVNVSALPPGKPAPELFGERRGVDEITPKQQRELAPPLPPSRPASPPPPAPPPPQLDVDHLTEDMFGSPFVSLCAPSGNQRRLSEASGRARNKGGTVGEGDTSRNGRDRRQLRGKGDDAATDTRGDSEADASAELIAASNYERLPYAEEAVIGNSSDVSYHGLGISHDAASAGRLVCPDRDPEEREEGSGDDPEGPSLAGDLGSKCVAEYDIREDLAIAMNLSESFSAASSSSVARLPDGATVGPPARQVKGTTEGCDPDGFSTSFTSSMMEKAFANDSFCDPAKEACPQMPVTSGDAASQKERTKRSSPEKSSLQSLPARENSKRRDGRDSERNRTSSQAKSDRHSNGSASGQSDGELVPPTPPEETSASASNPCVRRTPLRTCRARGEASRQLGQAAAGARTEGRTAAGARTEGRTAAGARTEGRTAAGARTEGSTAAGARTEGRTAAGARTEGRTAAGARTEGRTAAGARTEGRTAAGARTEGRTAAGARTEGSTAAGARTEGRTAAGARTEGRTAAGARTEGRTAAGAPTEGRTAAGAPTEGRTAAGAPTEGRTAAGAPTEGSTAAGAPTERRTAAGARTEGRTAAGARTEGRTAAGAPTEGRTAAGAPTEGRTAAGAPTEGRRSRRSQAPRDKENGRARREWHSSERTPAAPPSDDAQQRNKPVAQPSHPLQTRCLNLHPGKEAASLTVRSAHPGSHSKVDAGNGAPVEVDDDQLTQGSLCIIDVCANAELFATFVEEWRSQPVYAISVACEKKASPLLLGGGIGGNFMQGNPTVLADSSGVYGVEIPGDEDRVIVGLAVSWASHDAYYISFVAENTDASLDDTLAAPPRTQSITQDRTTQTVKEVLRLTEGRRTSRTVIAYDSKSAYSVLARGLGAVLGLCQDPQIASWLLDPGAREKTLHSMMTNFLPEALPLLEGIGGGVGYGSLGLSVRNPASGRLRAVAESIVARRLMDHFRSQLMEAGLDTAFTDTEMPSLLTMARMELNGFGFSEEECESQKNLLMGKLSALEQEAYTLAGHPFSLTSTDDIAQILYLELQLPVNGDPSAAKATRTLGPSRRAPRGRQKSTFSTSKDILEKLKAYHRLPGVILEWRRISNALTKHVYPLQKEKVFNGRVAMPRIFSECQLHTATGRVSMMEPNLQNVPRDFEITLPDVIGESPPTTRPGAPNRPCPRAGHSRLQAMRGAAPQAARLSSPSTAQHMAVSMRHAFVPFPGGVILTADYSQLELRVIAHLSGDRKLISILNNDGDVFKMIAAQWKNTLPEAVTTEERQHAKQICYGMLYGIGAKALGEQIGVEENDATVFMESFKAKYTGMRSYLRKTVEQCRENGYVTTITGRRRYLPAIRDAAPHARAQAERQAVNTTVQGSAADIVKAAMNMIDQELVHAFPHTRFPHRHRDAEAGQHRGAFLVLQLHDELIYEVSSSEVTQVAHIIKRCMETTTLLAVRLPVKVKVGPSWGRLEDVDI